MTKEEASPDCRLKTINEPRNCLLDEIKLNE